MHATHQFFLTKDLGVILHFKDLALLDAHVLNPKWATEAVYRIINAEQLAACKGILRLDLLEPILQPKTAADYMYPRDKYRYIIELMKKFELCYELDQQTVLIPDLVDVQEPRVEFDDANAPGAIARGVRAMSLLRRS
jgi:internalin A